MSNFYLKQNDLKPILQVSLLDPNGNAYDLTGAAKVWLHIRIDSSTVFSREMTVDADPTTGIATYTFLATDWGATKLQVGDYPMEFEVVWADSRLSFPNDHHDRIIISEHIADGAAA